VSRSIHVRFFVAALVFASVPVMNSIGQARAGQPAAEPAQTSPPQVGSPTAGDGQAKPPGQVRVLVTISRYTGDKKTASLPFTLWANLNSDPTSLNAGQNVLIPQSGFQSVGTSITCRARQASDGRFLLELHVRDTYLTPAKTDGDLATVKSVQTSNNLLLRDTQTAEFAASTDMTSGEVTRIDVTVTMLK
jgi:hypothetical protein